MDKENIKKGISGKRPTGRLGYNVHMTSVRKRISAHQVAEYFLLRSAQENKPISNKKLQKLVYYAQAWSLVLHKNKLFSDKIEAWVHGPAVRSLYGTYKEFGFSPIVKKIDEVWANDFSKKTKNLLNEVWRVYGELDAQYLETLTHSELPWIEAREGLQSDQNSEKEIDLGTMKDFYSTKLREAQA